LPGLAGQLFACEPSQNPISRGVIGRDNGRPTLTRLPEEAESEFFTSTDVWFHAVALAHAPDGGITVDAPRRPALPRGCHRTRRWLEVK
jgi:hypothetical protein